MIKSVRMTVLGYITTLLFATIVLTSSPDETFAFFGFFEGDKTEKEHSHVVPPEYAGKQLPSAWLTDPVVLAAGKAVYAEFCIECHGDAGKPTRKGRGAPDFSDPAEIHTSDDYWFWRVAEGKTATKMRAWNEILTDDEHGHVIAYMRTFSRPGK